MADTDLHEKAASVRIPVRYMKEWSLVADSKNGGRVGLVLEGVPMNTLVGLLNELQGSARRG